MKLFACLALAAAADDVSSLIQSNLPEDQNIIDLRDKYCAMHPATCASTLNCFYDPPLKPEWKRWHQTLATPDGHPNLKTLCFANDFEDNLIQHCLVNKDPIKSAELMFQKQVRENSNDFTASYCFMGGHCDRNEQLTNDVTLADGEKMCNDKYGDRWQKIGLDDLPASNEIGNENHVMFTGMRACAMAFYHCDAVMCQQQYCNKEEYKQKFGKTPRGPVAQFLQLSANLPEDQNIIDLRDKYCAMHPATCGATLNCFYDPPLKPEWKRWHQTLATPDGHPNLKTLCFANDFEDSLIQHCLVNRDPIKSAELMFQKQARENSNDFTASYCFMEGHCNRTQKFNNDLTLADGEKMCNDKYGDKWQKIGLDDLPASNEVGNKDHVMFTGMRACAMAFYHCDVVMCQEQYCNKDQYKQKFQVQM